jgi:hypothetical protein
MTRVALALIVFAMLAACSAAPTIPVRVTAPPVDAQCSALCTTSCVPAVWPKWEGDPLDPSTWDRLPDQVVAPLRERVEQCDKHREACVDCLHRLERVGIIAPVGLRSEGGGR